MAISLQLEGSVGAHYGDLSVVSVPSHSSPRTTLTQVTQGSGRFAFLSPAICDILITASVVYYLHGSRSGIEQSVMSVKGPRCVSVTLPSAHQDRKPHQ